MPRPHTPKLTKLDLLDYALDGAMMQKSLSLGYCDDDVIEQLNKDIKEIKRRIKLCQLATARKESQS